MIYYFHVDEDDTVNPCATIDARNMITIALQKIGFEWIESTGGQCVFEAVVDPLMWAIFKRTVNNIATRESYNLVSVKLCEDPGLGLFNHVHDWHNASGLEPPKPREV